MISKWCILGRSLATVGIGGAAGSLLTFLQSNADLAQVDFHKMAQTAGLGALMAVLFHFKTPPNQTNS